MNSFSPPISNSIALRPQPVGIFGGSAAHLLLPQPMDSENEMARACLNELLSGNLQQSFPAEWTFFQLAAQGDLDQALRELNQSASVHDFAGGITLYNRFVLFPSNQLFLELQNQLNGDLRLMLETAAYASGIAEHPPQLDSTTNPVLSGELAAWLLAISATGDLEHQDFQSAREKLGRAVDYAKPTSSLLAAMLTAQSANLAQHGLDLDPAVIKREYQSAIRLAEGTRLPGFLAELWTQVGMLIQQSVSVSREGLLEAIKAYQSAIQSGVDPVMNPRLFAELQNNLGLAYVAMSNSEASNQLRVGIAIQSFRRALEALDPETDGDLWARINMNLASALQYAPSSHPAENLVQAVEIYEQVLNYRTKARDPVAYSLVLLNQANALAHLGMFKPSLEKASEAYKLFQWYDQPEPAATARELVETVNQQLENTKGTPKHGTP
jgi:tetratricopeptide (TPR) repeat protein